MPDIRTSKQGDLTSVLDWLKREYDADGEGFWCNESIIRKAHLEGKLHVLVERGEPLGLYVGSETEMVILTVRKDSRCKGYGKLLAEFAIAKVRASGSCVVRIECNPRTSIPFWKHMGFSLDDPNDDLCNHGYMVFETRLALPATMERVPVAIRLFPERANWEPDTPAIREWVPEAAWDGSGAIRLAERVIFFEAAKRYNHDSVVEIVVNGRTLVKDKLKYDNTKQHGVDRAPCGTFCLDAVINANPNGAFQ